MRVGQMAIWAVIASVVVSAAVQSFCPSVSRGDINCDHCIDILDAQTLVAKLLTGAVPTNHADANRDGRVDICDLQFVLARLNPPASSESPVPSDEKAPWAIAVAADRSWGRVGTAAIEIIRHDTEKTRDPLCLNAEPVTRFSPREERYLFTLTANAPPFIA